MAERRRPARARTSAWTLASASLGALALGIATPSCLEPRESPTAAAGEQRCATCHGDPHRNEDYLLRAAPPRDLLGQTTTQAPGVGAHALHLHGSATHAPLPCQECHVVPERVGDPGHADDAPRAEVIFGELARHDGYRPSYDVATRTCSDSYCHGSARPEWTVPRTSDEACGSCHGLPPPAPHPQSERCSVCHAEVVDDARHVIAPKLHVDGKVQYEAGNCEQCHGSADSAAPPADLLGNREFTALGVGAHQAHLRGGAAGRPLACAECHVVPDKVEEPTHLDGPPVDVTLVGVAARDGHEPQWQRSSATCADTYCHSPTPGTHAKSPVWNEARNLDCQSCHGTPPPAPHPQLTDCVRCHDAVVGDDNRTIIDRERHVDGRLDLSFDAGCSSCHGDATSPAPPRDLAGEVDASSPGVGAHRAHLMGSSRARAVPCETCHRVPDKALSPGHIDTPGPAEVVFSGIPVAPGASPRYEAGSCRDTSCHGAAFADNKPSGGSNTAPQWTGGPKAAKCGACHGRPPPPPHPEASVAHPCHSCHRNLSDDETTFTHPELHVDGVVTFAVP